MARMLYVADFGFRRRAMAFDGGRADYYGALRESPRLPFRDLTFPGLTSHADRLWVSDDADDELWRSTVTEPDHHGSLRKGPRLPLRTHVPPWPHVACRPALGGGQRRPRAMAFDSSRPDYHGSLGGRSSTSPQGCPPQAASRRMRTGFGWRTPATTTYGVRQ